MAGTCSDGPRAETDPASSPAANCFSTMASATRDAGREVMAIQERVPRSPAIAKWKCIYFGLDMNIHTVLI